MHLFQQLDADWNRLIAAGETRHACLRWRREDAALMHVACAQDLADEIRTAGNPARSDALLFALVRLADNDDVAARTVLQALIPGMRRITQHLAVCGDAEEIDATVVACAWERIRTYPHERRPRRVAANILLDTRKAALRMCPFPDDREILYPDVPAVTDDRCETENLQSLLQEAVTRHLITGDDAQLISRTRSDGRSIVTEAALQGTTVDALSKRRFRAERRLRLVVAQ